MHSSWFDAMDPSLLGRVDLIVANPPYVGAAEFATLDPVLGYEPFGALVSEDTAPPRVRRPPSDHRPGVPVAGGKRVADM